MVTITLLESLDLSLQLMAVAGALLRSVNTVLYFTVWLLTHAVNRPLMFMEKR